MKLKQAPPKQSRFVPVVAAAALFAGIGRGLTARRHDNLPRAIPHPRTKKPAAGGIQGRLDAIGKRHPAVGLVLDVLKRYGEVHGNNLAASVTLQAFLSLFPLLLVIIAVVGFVSAGTSADMAGRIIGEMGLTGDAARAVVDAIGAAEKSRRAASVVGLVGLLWSGLGLVNALQYAYDQVWQVKERGMKDKAVGVAWLLGAGLLFTAGGFLTAGVGWLPGFMAPLAILAGLTVNFALWMWTAHTLPNRDVGWRPLVPGAILGAVGLEALKAIGAFYVPRLVSSSSQLYGSIGTIFALLAWLLLFSRLVVYSASLNVVLYERKHGTTEATIEVPDLPRITEEETTRTGRIAVAR